MAMVSRCLSVSTSCMLAALRVLHVDTSHARVGGSLDRGMAFCGLGCHGRPWFGEVDVCWRRT